MERLNMKEENISNVQIYKKFKKHYLVPTNHNIVPNSIEVFGVDNTNKRLMKVHYENIIDDNRICVIIPKADYSSYVIYYKVQGNFKRIIVKPEDYISCKNMDGTYEFIL